MTVLSETSMFWNIVWLSIFFYNTAFTNYYSFAQPNEKTLQRVEHYNKYHLLAYSILQSLCK